MIVYKRFICLLFLISILSACEYDNDPVFEVRIAPPDVGVEIELSQINPNNTIYIYQYTMLTYRIDAKAKEILDFKISIDANAEIFDNTIYLYPLDDNSVRKLIFEIQLKTNSGSIADYLGYENYVGRYEYNVKFVKRNENFGINFRGEKSDDGYLLLSWDEPIFDNATFQKYELTFYNWATQQNETQTITNIEQTSFIDMDYVWGHKTYELSVWYINNDVGYVSYERDYFTPEYYGFKGDYDKFEYQILDDEWMTVSWPSPGYKCKYLFIDSYGVKIECDENQRTITTQRFKFPSDHDRFYLAILPYNQPYDEYEKSVLIRGDDYWYTGENNTGAPTPHAWSLSKDEFYSAWHYEMNIYSISGFSKKRDYFLREIGYFDLLYMSTSAHTSQIAIYKHEYHGWLSEIFIYDNSDFENPLYLQDVNRHANPIYLCDNYTLFHQDLFLMSPYDDFEKYWVIADSRTGNEIFRSKQQNIDSKIAVSPDGKYLCDYDETYLIIYEIQGNNATQIYANTSYRYSNCQFSYTNPEELILTRDAETVILDMRSLGVKSSVKGTFLVQDPVNGNIACMDENFSQTFFLNIYSETLSDKLTRIPFNYYTPEPYSLMNSRLIFNGFMNYYVDLFL